MDRLTEMEAFATVVDQGGFTDAARKLGISKSAVSKHVSALEARLGARLLNRTTRRVALTAPGTRFLERCGALVDEAKLVRSALANESNLPTGHLRISMPVDLGKSIIGPMLPTFAKRYPGITFSLDLSSQLRDLLGGETDVALRLSESKEKSLVTRRIGWLGQALYASPGYIEIAGRPIAPQDLTSHECIFIGGVNRAIEWTMRSQASICKVSVNGRFSVNNHGLISALAESGVGIAMLEPSLCREAINAGRLIPVLSEWEPAKLPVFVVTASRVQNAAARAFIEYVADRFASR